MRWQDIDQQVCSVARSLAVVGDRWTLLVLRDAFMGTRRFEDFQRQLGISRHRLSDRLSKLVEAGVFRKEAYQQRPLRHEYRLTRKGLALYPVLMMLAQWGDEWRDDGNGPPVEYYHQACGQTVRAVLSCSECGERLQPAEVTPRLGPGLRAALAEDENHEPDHPLVQSLPPLLKTSLAAEGLAELAGAQVAAEVHAGDDAGKEYKVMPHGNGFPERALDEHAD